MQFINIFIDRVKNTNVFNTIEGLMLSYHKHLSTVVDEDLIQEFLTEIENLGYTAGKLDASDSISQIDSLSELEQISETFFRQFFPEEIQEQLRNAEPSFLLLHVTPNLQNIPWELLYNTDHFIADRFYIAKSTSHHWIRTSPVRKESLRMLIIADPTEDLAWAREEGEKLSEALHANLNSDRIQIQMLSGRNINKIQLLHMLKEFDIIHYAGHMYHHPDPRECGWLLSDNKIVRTREIKKSGAVPLLVFSNSCLGSPVRGDQVHNGQKASEISEYLSDLPSVFMNTCFSSYIGTYWELQDNRTACDFALQFYLSMFEERPLGKALFEARKFARNSYPTNNLTWANYTLHGDPSIRIVRPRQKRSFDASRTGVLLWHIRETYPLPISQNYLKFLIKHNKNDVNANLKLLYEIFQSTLQTVASIVFANCNYFNINSELPNTKQEPNLRTLIACIYKCRSSLRELKLVLVPTRLINCLYLHRREIDRLLTWSELFMVGKLKNQNLEAYSVTFQYLLENFLNDLTPFRHCYFIYVKENNEKSILLSGRDPQELSLTSHVNLALKKCNNTAQFKNQVCLLYPSNHSIVPLGRYLQYDTKNQKISFSLTATLPKKRQVWKSTLREKEG